MLIDDNPLNARSQYDERDIESLAASLRTNGLLTSIKVRRKKERYELVCGHRRVRAARLLNLEKIPAEVCLVTDEQMLRYSLVENLDRKELSDFEKAKAFSRMNTEFGITYQEIARLVGFSKQHVSNFIRMTELFDEDILSTDPTLISDLNRISEHHARLLSQVHDQETRRKTIKLVISQNLSVRDLDRIIHRLRSWFGSYGQTDETNPKRLNQEMKRTDVSRSDLEEINRTLRAEFELPHKDDFEAFDDMHAFDHGFSIYSNFPPYHRLDRIEARDKEKHWFYTVAPNYSVMLRDIDVQFFGDVALATLYVDYKHRLHSTKGLMTVRGTVFFIRTPGRWKIQHEHWSRLTMDTVKPNIRKRATSL